MSPRQSKNIQDARRVQFPFGQAGREQQIDFAPVKHPAANGFLQGMDRAAAVDSMRSRFMQGQQPEATQGGWTSGDALTTRTQAAPAGMTRRDRPTRSDAIDAKRKRALSTEAIPTPQQQRMDEHVRKTVEDAAAAFERGLAAAQNKQKRQ